MVKAFLPILHAQQRSHSSVSLTNSQTVRTKTNKQTKIIQNYYFCSLKLNTRALCIFASLSRAFLLLIYVTEWMRIINIVTFTVQIDNQTKKGKIYTLLLV